MTTAVPLNVLAQRIAEQQSELETLRQEFESRQTHLADLARRKQELEAQLAAVEAEIQAIDQGKSTAARSSPQARRGRPPIDQQSTGRLTLPELLVRIVQEAAGPVTVKHLADEVVRRKFSTSSRNLPEMIKTRVSELVRKGRLKRVPGQPGVLAATAAAARAAAPQGVPSTRTARVKRGGPRPKVPLRAVLVEVLAKSTRPLAARELADKVIATGYRTTSKNFKDVIWVMAGKMENVENVPGQGYRLKRR